MSDGQARKKILYLDMDGVLVDFKSGFDALPPEVQDEYRRNPDDAPGIYGLMRPLEGAVDAFHELRERFDTYILSTPPWNNPSGWSDKRLWVAEWLGLPARKRLILSHNKHLNLGDYLVDDSLRNGAQLFAGEHVHFGHSPFETWDRVLRYLRTRA